MQHPTDARAPDFNPEVGSSRHRRADLSWGDAPALVIFPDNSGEFSAWDRTAEMSQGTCFQ